MSGHEDPLDLVHLQSILATNIEPTMKHIRLEPEEAQKMYDWLLAPDGLFPGILTPLWNQTRTTSRFVNEHGYVHAQVARETDAGKLMLVSSYFY